MTCSPSLGWLCRSTPCASFPPRMRSQLQGSDLYPGGSTSHWIHQPSPGHTVRLLPPEPLVVNNHSLLGSREPTLLCDHVALSSCCAWFLAPGATGGPCLLFNRIGDVMRFRASAHESPARLNQ